MNKRNFIKSLITAGVGVGFTILPSASTYGRVWRSDKLVFPSFISVHTPFITRGAVGSSSYCLDTLTYHERVKLVKNLDIFDFIKQNQAGFHEYPNSIVIDVQNFPDLRSPKLIRCDDYFSFGSQTINSPC